MKFPFQLILLLLGATVAPLLPAQSAPGPSAADDFAALKRLAESPIVPAPSPNGTTNSSIGAYLSQADQLAAYEAGHAGDPNLAEARRLEAQMLLNAKMQGDTSSTDRCAALVASVRSDSSLPGVERYAIASLADLWPLNVQTFASRTDRVAAFAKTLRALATEFPNVPSAYEALLALAKDAPAAQCSAIATGLLTTNATPAVKAQAQLLLDRLSLVGKSLGPILQNAASAKLLAGLAAGQPTVIYTWTAWNEGSIWVAKDIAAHLPAGVNLLGVNLDSDAVAAVTVATARGLPGVQLPNPAGAGSKLSTALSLTPDSLVIVANRQGTIISVTGRVEFAEAFAAASQ